MKKLVLIFGVLAASAAMADINELDNEKTHNVDCTKDKIVNLVGNNNTVTLNGTCDAVNISGNENSVTGSVKGAFISGNDNKLALESVDRIAVSGNKNTVSYKKPIAKKKVAVGNSGKGNKIGKAK